MSQDSHRRRWGLAMIGVYKLAKAAVLLIGGAFVLRLKPNDILDGVIRIVARFRFDPEDELIHATIARLSGLSEKRLVAIGAGIVFYGLLYLVEGVGLLLQKRWAEYLVVVTTGLLIPLEVYEVFKKGSPLRIAVLLANVAIVAYLIRTIQVEMRSRDAQPPGTSPQD
ncbi:Uncharacterized membrane protein, DUF2068 family [Singulisphaera sp. GP187]|uniref:DUF2127 domain-containing protein n=1 Tax=Singulisphaera sp. GP187 TaxID=1882752 RepID=UPI0009265CCF|nr:DUF2127 domain-containing protein [Singulisphaera sp. GP187]SIN96020.1 Uncharacterized membrane protein, DUF2068 family [Singulisphaera sp. GP187]